LIGDFDKMKIFRSFSGILVTAAIGTHLLLTVILFSSILSYVEKSYQVQFVENARAISNMLVNQTVNNIQKKDNDLEGFLDELLLSGNITFAEIKLNDGTTYLPREMMNSEMDFVEDFYFAKNDDNTYFISAPFKLNTESTSGNVRFGFDETLIQESINTAYYRGIYLATGYVVLVIILIIIFVPKFTYSLRLLKNAAHNISSGHSDESLEINTRIDEFNSVFSSLEKMRLALVNQNKLVKKK